MGTSRRRLASRQEAFLLFGACAFPVYTWSILRYLWKVPGWEKHLEFWHIASILAYVLVFALAESLLIFLPLVLLRALSPASIISERFVAKASFLMLVNGFWAIVLHHVILSGNILLWTASRYIFCVILYLASVSVSWALVHRSDWLAGRAEGFVARLSVFLYVYIPLSVLSVIVVTVRNVQ